MLLEVTDEIKRGQNEEEKITDGNNTETKNVEKLIYEQKMVSEKCHPMFE